MATHLALPAGREVFWRVDEDEVVVQAGEGKQALDRGRTADEREVESVLSRQGVGLDNQPKAGTVQEMEPAEVHDDTALRGHERLQRVTDLVDGREVKLAMQFDQSGGSPLRDLAAKPFRPEPRPVRISMAVDTTKQANPIDKVKVYVRAGAQGRTVTGRLPGRNVASRTS
jgi:hypothetical protein